jgi:hypothetical protein
MALDRFLTMPGYRYEPLAVIGGYGTDGAAAKEAPDVAREGCGGRRPSILP